MLFTDDKQLWLSISEVVNRRLVISKCRADEHDVIELVTGWATELVHEELRHRWYPVFLFEEEFNFAQIPSVCPLY